jgi:hypothetical protein
MRRLLVITFLCAAAFTARADWHVIHRFSTSVPLRNIRRVVVAIPAGEINLHNGTTNDIVASGSIRRKYDDDEDDDRGRQRGIDDVDVEIYTNGKEAIVRRHFGRTAHGWRFMKFTGVDLDLAVPPGVDVEFETKAGEIRMEGTFGNVDTDLRAGEIHVVTPRASVKELNASCRIGEVHTHIGDRTIEREGVFPGTTHFVNHEGGKSTMNLHTTFGEVHVTLTQ